MVSEVGEMLIKIAFEVDPKGAKEAVDKLNDVGDAAKGAGKKSEEAKNKYTSLHREISTSTRAISMAGMGLAHLGMALGTTGAVTQQTAAQLTSLGSALTAGSVAVRMIATTMDAANKIFTSTNLILVGLALAIAGAVYLWQQYSRQQKLATGDFKDFSDLLDTVGTDFDSYDAAMAMVNQEMGKWIEKQKQGTLAVKTFRENLIATNPVVKVYADLQERLKNLNKETTLLNRSISGQREGLATITEGYNKWKDAIRDAADAQEALEDGARSLKLAQMDLNDLLAEGVDVEQKWVLAQAMYKTGALSAKGLEKARSEHERYQLRLEGARDAIDDQVKSNKENSDKLTEANKTIKEMKDIWGNIYGNVANMKIAIDSGNKSLLEMEASAQSLDSAIFDTQNQLTTIAEVNPEIIGAFNSIEQNASKIAAWWLQIRKDMDQAAADAKIIADLQASGGYAAVAMYGTAGGEAPVIQSGAVGTPYVPRDMNVRVHTGEAIIPANQNSYNDNISIKNLTLSRGYGMDAFMKDRDRAIRIKRKMLGYT